jgi:hypothetical protein
MLIGSFESGEGGNITRPQSRGKVMAIRRSSLGSIADTEVRFEPPKLEQR